MPNQNDITEMFESLVLNGLDFLGRSTASVQSDPKFSIVCFAAGLELILKARLFSEHWTLVAANPHGTSWHSFRNGDINSLAAGKLTDAIVSITGAHLKTESAIFREAFAHRNRALHFVLSETSSKIATDQFRSWFYLHRLLVQTWRDEFHTFLERIADVDGKFRGYIDYIRVRFERLETEHHFDAAKAAEALIDCPVCNMSSGILVDPEEPVSAIACPVCDASGSVANFGCGNWHDVSDGLYGTLQCSCGKEHAPQDLASLMDTFFSSRRTGEDDDTQYHCGECLQNRTVVMMSSGLRCVGCNAEFSEKDIDQCGWCNESWIGYDCSDTDWRGCEFCDGKQGDIADE